MKDIKTAGTSRKKYIVLSIIIILFVLIDQLSKYYVSYKMDHNKNYAGIKHIFSFEYLENKGVAFGFLSGKFSLITILVIIVSLFILYAIYVIEKSILECQKMILSKMKIDNKNNESKCTNDKSSINNIQSINKIDSTNHHYSEINLLDIDKLNSVIKKYTILQIICAFLISGSVGNMVDRIRLGYVIDFIKFDFIDFPIFNIADCYVTVSVFILLIMILFFISEDELQLIKIRK
ncbi:MAG: signal peptidase II [Lachnospiraceae bacterium]|nr:signal peptidase II [Lachnospiraceae bacterium]